MSCPPPPVRVVVSVPGGFAFPPMQVFGQEEREAAGFKRLAGAGFEVAQQYAIYQGLVEGAGRLAVNVGTVSLLGFGGGRAGQGWGQFGSSVGCCPDESARKQGDAAQLYRVRCKGVGCTQQGHGSCSKVAIR